MPMCLLSMTGAGRGQKPFDSLRFEISSISKCPFKEFSDTFLSYTLFCSISTMHITYLSANLCCIYIFLEIKTTIVSKVAKTGRTFW